MQIHIYLSLHLDPIPTFLPAMCNRLVFLFLYHNFQVLESRFNFDTVD